jgi:type III pantothenate kinase
MRYLSLNKFTAKLPLLQPSKNPHLVGTNTDDAIHSGVINGMMSEIDGMIQRYIHSYSNIKVLITGGDAIFFDKGLKNTIFAHPDLLMIGLNKILDYNEPIL